MPERQNPDTSLEAWKQVKTSDMQTGHYAKIKEGLIIIGKGNYEMIAAQIRLDKHQVHRRISEMERHDPPLIFKTAEKLPTSTGRQAYVYQLTPPLSQPLNLPLEGKSVGDFASNIIDMTQLDLFNNSTQ